MAIGNVTIDPAAPATAVVYPEIEEIRSTRSGLILNAQQFIRTQRYDRLIRSRNQILEAMHRGEPRMVCAICSVPVYLISSVNKAFSFRHSIEDGSCPAQTRGAWSHEQIRAMKYQGAQESEAHRRVKGLVDRSLRADPQASEVHQERTWRSAACPASYRRPDVQALYIGVRLAFEVQLTTTFLDVVVGRRQFYREDGALLVWVLPRFDPDYRRLTEDDIIFTNNHNVLVANEETAQLSEARLKCMFLCYYREPFLDGGVLAEKWSERLVGLDELTFDLSGQRSYCFDFDHELARVRHEAADRLRQIEEEARLEREGQAAQLRADFSAFWERNGGWENCDADEDEQWQRLRERFQGIGVDVPTQHKTGVGDFRSAVSGLLSAKLGRPVGFQFRKVIEVAHHLAEAHKGVLYSFGWALRIYGSVTILNGQDTTGRWREKAGRIREAMISGDLAYAPDQTWGAALKFLFPELAEKVDTPDHLSL